MHQNDFSRLGDFAIQQVAAESYVSEFFAGRLQRLEDAYVLGNNRPGFPDRNFTRMTPQQASDFVARFKILQQEHHYPNDASGYSATLLFDTHTNEYTFSIRSTEFRNQSDGGDFERDFGAGAEIAGKGFAFAQIASMERFYRDVVEPAVGSAKLNVTGYSLGGHLATVFTELHPDAINQTLLFNAPGRGGLKPATTIQRVVDIYEEVLTNPEQWSRYVPSTADRGRDIRFREALALHRSGRPLNSANIYHDPRHQWAIAIASEFTTSVIGAKGRIDPRAEEKITRVFGHATSNDPEGVAKVGILPSRNVVQVFIEDQPNFTSLGGFAPFGVQLPGDFGNTHSITLLVDSLALMSVFKDLDSNLTQAQIESILAAASHQIATGSLFAENARAEGNSLENGLDALRRIFVGAQAPGTSFDSREGGFGNLQTRTHFHQNLSELKSALIPFVGAARVMPLAGQSAADLKSLAEGDVAYRYALRELNPFVVTGIDQIYASRNSNGELELASATTGQGQLSADWLSTRAAMLSLLVDRNVRDSGYSVATGTPDSLLYEDRRLGARVFSFDADTAKNLVAQRDQLPTAEREAALLRIYEQREQAKKGARIVFGRDDNGDVNEALNGRLGADRLYGGEGKDALRGAYGDDWLEGGEGDDVLRGGFSTIAAGFTDNDTLLGGKGNDILAGGPGTDKYYFYTGGGADEVFDVAEGAAGAKRQLGEIYFNDVRVMGTFRALDPDRRNFKLGPDGDAYFAVYLGDFSTAMPGKLVLYKETDGSNVVTLNKFISGDFGIVLDANAPVRTYTDRFGTADADNANLVSTPHQGSLASDAADQKVFGLQGSDFISVSHAHAQGYGGADNDYLTNGPDDQSLYGEAGRDVLLASAGDDSLYGGLDDDALQGGADRDYLEGNEGNDVLDGGAGEDAIAGGDGHDFIFGGGSVTVSIASWDGFADGSVDWGAFDAAGEVLIRGLAGLANVEGDAGDVITGGAGNDWVFAGDGNDAVSGGLDDDYLVGQAGDDEVSGDEGADTLYGDGAQGDLSTSPGSFSVFTFPEFHGKDSLSGGAGDDFVSGDGEADELHGGEGNDTLIGDSGRIDESFHGADHLDGGEGNDVLLGYGKEDTLFGGAGDDTLGGDASTIADSTHGNDYLDGEDGADTLHGDGGADTLFGGAGDDILDGDASNVAFEAHGDDYLEGEEGNDALQGGGGADRLFGGAGNDSLAGDVAGIPEEFAGDDYLDGEAGNDILDGGAGNDTLTGGAGVDTLMGGAGDDLYLVNLGSQNDFIQDREGADTVRLGAPGTFVFQALGSDGKAYLGLRYSASDIVHIQEGLTNTSIRTELSDGTVRTAADWRASFTQFVTVPGSSGSDTLSGSALAESFSPGGGNDTILFERGSGFDRVLGFGQVMGGVQGLDRIQLGAGIAAEDLLVRNIAGHLTLAIADTGDTLRLDHWYSSAAQAHAGAQVQFAGGTMLSGADLIALALASSDGNDLLIGGNAAEVISGGLGDDGMVGGEGADTLLGGEGDDALSGGPGEDTLEGGAGNDVLRGDAGADTYLFGAGDGNDTIQDSGADVNIVQFKPGITPADVTLNQGSIVVTLNATGETLTTTGVQELRFADGTVWDAALINENANHATPFADLLRGIDTADTLYGLSGDDMIEGFSGDDVLAGGDGNDVLDGGAGADDLDGGAGNDTLKGGANGDVLDGGAGDDTLHGGAGENIFLVGEGNDTVLAGADDTLVLGDEVQSQDVVVARDGAGYRLDFGSGSVRLVSSLIREVRFADGAAWGQAELNARITEVGVSIVGGDGNDAVTGGAGADALNGGAGDDLVQGGLGADLLIGGEGNDRLYGHNQFSPQGDTAENQLFGDAGADQLFGSASGEILDGGADNDSISAGGGDDSLLGGAGNDSLSGDAGNDTLDGGAGDDGLNGGFGSDTYRFGRAGGHDTVSDAAETLGPNGLVVPTGDLNVIRVDPGIRPDEIVVHRSGALLVLTTIDEAASIRATFFSAELGPAGLLVRFDDGSEWDTAALVTLAGSPPGGEVPGTSGNDSLFGAGGDDLLAGLDGNDALDANAGNDRLEGGAGDDTLIGGQGDDTLDGGAGNDLLVGGFGNDTYVFGYGWGSDTISEPGDTSPPTLTQALTGERDRILFAPGVGSEDVVLLLDGSGSETIALLGSIDALTISGVEFAEFEDGTVWDLGRLPLSSLGTGSTRHFGTVGSDSRTLGADDDIFFGLGGSDSLTDLSGHNTLYGNELNDTLSTGAGDDVLSGGAGNDNFSPRSGDNVIRFGRGAGQDTLTLARHINDVGSDTVVFGQEVSPEHLRLRRGPGGTLIVEIAGTPDSLTIQDDFNANQGRPRLRFQFAGGTLWDAAQIESHIQTVALIEGGTGNNTLVGGDGVDVFVGGPGNDTLTGGGGQDSFVFVRGDGSDTIIDESPRLVFGEGILPQDVTLSPSNFAAGLRDLIVTIAGGGGQITARNWFPSTHAGAIEFADGTVWDSIYVGTRVPFTFVSGATGSYTGTLGNDTFTMGSTADTMRGEAGDDALTGDGGNDQLFGGTGDDTLSAGVGNDNLQGEAGNDLLDAGVDTLGAGETDSDSLSGGDGNDALIGRAGNDGLTGGAGDDTLDAGDGDDALDGGSGNDALSGGLGNDLLEAGPGDDLVDGGAGHDRLYGGSGSDVYLFGIGSGSDTLLDFDATGSAIDTIRMGAGVAPQDVVVTRTGADLVLRLAASADSLRIRSFGRQGYGSERVLFEDGTIWDTAQLAGMAASVAASGRADVIFGSAGADALAGLGGDDIIDGGAEADALDGGAGDDVLLGGAGDDTLDGGAGFDHLTGGAGADTFVIEIDSGSDAIADLGAGDTLTLGPGIPAAGVKIARDRDHLYLEAGTTGQFITLENWFANGANGTVAFSDGTQWDGVYLEATVDSSTEGGDFLVGTEAGETFAPLAGLDTVLAGGGEDVVSGGEGSDTLHGEDGNDVLLGEAGFDLLAGGDGDDALDGGADDDALSGDQGNDSLAGGEGFDELSGGTGNDVLDGGSGDDILLGDAGDDVLLGGEGADALTGGDGADVLDGGTGDDTLNGGAGNDIYVYAIGSGPDTITESGSTISTSDALRLSGLSPSEVEFRRFATYTVLEIAGSADTVTFSELNFPFALVVERAEFDDGTVWNQTDIGFQTINVGTEGDDFLSGFKGLVGLGGNDTLTGGPGDNVLDGGDGADTLNGSTGNDRLIGGAGNDTLNGGTGDDAYVFGGGSGDDTVANFDAGPGRRDVLAFTPDVMPQDVVVERVGNHLRVVLNGGADRLRVDNWFNGLDVQLSEAQFADGTVWSAADLESRIVLAAPTGGDDVLIGLTGNDTIDGLGGNDRLEGGAGNDVLLGNTGDDTLFGGIGADMLDGGAGDDSLDGGAGNDVYVFGPNSGLDTISDVDATAGNLDAVLLDALPAEVTVTQQFPHLVLTLAGGERLTLQNWSSGDAQKVEEVRFTDGTVWDVATLAARSIAPVFGTEDADFLQGTSGADSIDALGGNDLIWAGAGSDNLIGGAGNDTLNAESGNDTLDGGIGNDVLNGGVGNDAYRFAAGYGLDTINEFDTAQGNVDVVEVNGLPIDATVRRAGSNLELRLASDALVVTGWFTNFAQQVELVRFSDGTTWDVPTLDTLAHADLPHTGTALADALYGTNDADTLEGLEGNDRLEGRGGDDALVGGEGTDTLVGGAGDDIYRFAAGDGFDTINEQSGFDVLEFGTGITPTDVGVRRIGDGALLTLFGGTQQVALTSWANSSTSAFRVEEIRFAGGTVWDERFIFDALRASDGADFVRVGAGGERIDALQGNDVVLGGPGDDELLGNSGDDTLSGEAGADTLDGGAGRDLLQGGLGDDRFVFASGHGNDWITDSGGLDEVVFGPGLTTSNVIFTRDLSDLFVTAGADRLTLVDWFAHPDFRVEFFRFGDGTMLSEGDVRNLIRPVLPSALNDTIFGSDSDEAISGLAGEDALYGEGGNDTLDGGDGSDYMAGGPGDDTYFVDIRLDRVTEGPNEGVDTVIASTSHALTANMENLTLSGSAAINGTGNSLDNALIGNTGANLLDGGSGNDSLRGGMGDDVYVVRRGDGVDEIIDVDPTAGNQDAVRFGADVAPSQVRVSRIDNDILLRIAGGGEAFLRNWFDPAYRIESVSFADGTAWDAATIEFLSTLPSNLPPAVSAPIADLGVLEDSTFEFSVPEGTFTDPDVGDMLAYAAARADGSPLPDWLVFEPATATFSGTPGNADVGALDVLVTATDAIGESASDVFRIEVQNVNDAPIVASPLSDRIGRETEILSLVLPADAFADVDAGDALALTAGLEGSGALPTWLAFDPAAGAFSGAPDTGDAGTYRVQVTATDNSGASAADVFELVIESAGGPGQTIVGTPGDDVLAGTPFDDILDGLEGSDRLAAGAGNDMLMYAGDDRWDGHLRARHAGSPGHAGTGDTESIAGKNRSHDIFDGGDGFDVLMGTDGHDVLFLEDSFSPPDGHDGPRLASVEHIATGEGHDLVDLTSRRFGYDDVVLDGGDGHDVLWASAGDDVLIGGSGNDKLSGGAGEDVYLHGVHDGHDVIDEAGVAGQLDVLRFGEGITQEMVRARRSRDDLVLDLRGPHDRVTIKDWFDSSSKRVERIEFADGSAWDESAILHRVQGQGSEGWCDPRDGRGHDRDDDHHGRDERDDRRHEHDDGSRRNDDWHGGRHGKPAHFDFDDFYKNARGWSRVQSYANRLATEDQDDPRHGAPTRSGKSWSLLGAALGGGMGWGYDGSVGAARGPEDLKSLEGLVEGFRRL